MASLGLAPLLVLLALAAAGASSHHDVEGVANGTAEVIGALRDTGAAAAKRFANASEFEQQLDKVGHHTEADFDSDLYSVKEGTFAQLAQKAAEKAKQAKASTNASVAEELSDEAEAALRSMTKVDSELDAMEKGLHDKLHSALAAKLDPELAAADEVSGEASHLQKRAHSTMDPLYSWGDNAEDKADKLNDQTNDALSAVEKVVRPYRRHIERHAREVQRGVERKLFAGQDRTAAWRKANRAVRAATWHATKLRYLEDAGAMSLQLGSVGGVAVLAATSAAAAAVGALVAFSAMMRTTRRSDYQLLLSV